MEKLINSFMSEHFETYFEVVVAPYMRKHYKRMFPELEKNICLEHYNAIHKTNFNENEIELNPTECWVCKARKDRP